MGLLLFLGVPSRNRFETVDESCRLFMVERGAWSYGRAESFSLFIPNINGGATGYIGNNEVAMNAVNSQYKNYIQQQNQYWGNQPFTSGPVYLGAIIFFLAFLAMFVVKDKIKWWLFTITVLSIILAWGKNAGFVTDFFFDYFPFYNKFRTVSMILTIAGFSVPVLAFLGLKQIIENKEDFKKNLKPLWISLGFTAGIAFIFWLIPSIFNFLSGEEQKYFADLGRQAPDQRSQINAFLEQLKNARIAIFIRIMIEENNLPASLNGTASSYPTVDNVMTVI